MTILLTGGTGYIASHTAVTLLEAGQQVVLLDNLSNSRRDVVSQIERIRGRSVTFVEGDVRDTQLVRKTLEQHRCDSVIHFAGLKAVGESVARPILYYTNNVEGTVSLLQAMEGAGARRLVFSSSATVYGEPKYLPYDEHHPTAQSIRTAARSSTSRRCSGMSVRRIRRGGWPACGTSIRWAATPAA